MLKQALPCYDTTRAYRWNYDQAPILSDLTDVLPAVPAVSGDHWFCNRKVGSPLGVSAGPLLNGKWCLYYAALGFDVLTYKTVRSSSRACYPLPNLLPVDVEVMRGGEPSVSAERSMSGSWAVSFGMPSAEPESWRRDVQATRDSLPASKVLSVSVVGTVQDGWGMEELASDYARCAKWAVESGADCVETNFSCPNVSSCDGQLFQSPENSRLIARVLREAIGDTPLIIKVGHLTSVPEIERLVDAIGNDVDAISMTNSIATRVVEADGATMFDGQPRGICGDAIRVASIEQTRQFANVIRSRSMDLKLIGVGGIRSAQHIREYMDAGAHACHLATSAMVDPMIGIEIRKVMASGHQ
ncbi:MAG: hypothetical protein AB8B91_04135 [Rubripirellula sp.]